MSAPLESAPAGATIAAALRRAVLDYYATSGEALVGAAGRATLETNSARAVERSEVVLAVLSSRARVADVGGLDVLDLGCGFGALSVVLARRGASVTGLDPNGKRQAVGRRVAAELGLPAEFVRGRAERTGLPDASFDLVVANNSLCYVIEPEVRRAAFAEVLRVLRPGGWFVARNPERLFPLDQFSGLPGINLLGPDAAVRVVGRMGRSRSRVRLLTPSAARRELERAGFADVASAGRVIGDRVHPAGVASRYQHLVGRRPRLGS